LLGLLPGQPPLKTIAESLDDPAPSLPLVKPHALEKAGRHVRAQLARGLMDVSLFSQIQITHLPGKQPLGSRT
jgi:hypothetical protein